MCGRNAEIMCLWITLENIRIGSELYPKILGAMKIDLFNKEINDSWPRQMLYFGLIRHYGIGLFLCEKTLFKASVYLKG